MANTTNYNWETPDDTDLVKDGAAAIRTLGNSVDTTTKALNPSTTLGDIEYRSSTANTNVRLGIGSAGQVLTVSSGVPSWATPSDQTPLTTKGDIFTFTTEDARLGIGANGTILTADSAEATGMKWATPSDQTPLTTKGDLFTFTTVDARLAIGTNGTVLTADSSEATGMKWAAGSSGALTLISTTTLSGSTTNVDSVFSATYDNYLIQVSMDNNNTVGAMTMQLRASGSATTSGYYFGIRQIDWSGVAATVSNGSASASARIGTTFNGSPSPVTFTMFNPNRALRTTFQGLSLGADTGVSGSQMYWGGFQDSTTQFTGFSIIGGSQTGKVRVYGYSN